ncbi:FAD/NAD(P)-binding protein, partial [Streptomyces sp. URMC 123]|uniref:FAD/NAD(P)-binding protein n=1 Tax=Streptomyces sp. URMC 123 TaxID=3423403 RepID=UPI003F1BD8A1
MGREVVIVGAGAAGTSVLLHLVAQIRGGRATDITRVHVVDPNPPGWGLAFGDRDPLLLCNTAAEINSLDAERPDDFVTFLRSTGWSGRPTDCVPRHRMAEYCQDRFTRCREEARERGVEVRHVRAAAESVEPSPADGRCRVRLRAAYGDAPAADAPTAAAARDAPAASRNPAAARALVADDVVVCTGVRVPRTP